jgi:hypothetical protein
MGLIRREYLTDRRAPFALFLTFSRRSALLFVSNTTNLFQPMRLVQKPDGSYINEV